jgi:hypothetical protein
MWKAERQGNERLDNSTRVRHPMITAQRDWAWEKIDLNRRRRDGHQVGGAGTLLAAALSIRPFQASGSRLPRTRSLYN